MDKSNWMNQGSFQILHHEQKTSEKQLYFNQKSYPTLVDYIATIATRNTTSAAKCALKMYSEENTLVSIGEKKAAHNIWMYETWTFPLEVMNWACWVRSVNFTQALVKSSAHPGLWRTGRW